MGETITYEYNDDMSTAMFLNDPKKLLHGVKVIVKKPNHATEQFLEVEINAHANNELTERIELDRNEFDWLMVIFANLSSLRKEAKNIKDNRMITVSWATARDQHSPVKIECGNGSETQTLNLRKDTAEHLAQKAKFFSNLMNDF